MITGPRISVSVDIYSTTAGSSVAPVITASPLPQLAALADGDTVSSGYTAGTYASTEGTIDSEVETVTVNGSTESLSYVVAAGDVVSISVLVTDSSANTRSFGTGSQTVSGVAPTLVASDGLSGRTLTITVDSSTGAPAPTFALTTLTLDGSPVAPTTSAASTWTLDVPDSVSSQSVVWQITASNFEGDATASGSETVAANLFAPTAASGIADQSWVEDSAITPLDVSTDFSGTSPITYALAPSSDALPAGLSLSSAGVVSGTPTTVAASVNIVVRGTNAHGSDDTAFGVEITAAASFLLDLYPSNVLAAWSLRRLASATTDVVEVRRSTDGAEMWFTPEEVEDGTLVSWVTATSATADGFAVRVTDQANGHTAVQTIASQQARVVNNGTLETLNGKPTLHYVGSNESVYVLPSAIHGLSNSANKVFAQVAEVTETAESFYRTIYIGNSGSSKVTYRHGRLSEQEVVVLNGFGNSLTYSRSPNVPRLTWAEDRGGAMKVYTNSTTSLAASSSGGGTDTSNEARLGGNASVSNFWNGPLGEMILFDGDVETNRVAIMTEIADYWGITL